jgi:hypothetical protein
MTRRHTKLRQWHCGQSRQRDKSQCSVLQTEAGNTLPNARGSVWLHSAQPTIEMHFIAADTNWVDAIRIGDGFCLQCDVLQTKYEQKLCQINPSMIYQSSINTDTVDCPHYISRFLLQNETLSLPVAQC